MRERERERERGRGGGRGRGEEERGEMEMVRVNERFIVLGYDQESVQKGELLYDKTMTRYGHEFRNVVGNSVERENKALKVEMPQVSRALD
jgi:cobyrinic acid a,c-diamide synthase